MVPSGIGVARVLRLGGKCQLTSTYPLSKTENSSDLVHYFLGGAPNSQLKIQMKNDMKKLCLGGPMPGLKDPKVPRTEDLPE